MAPLGNSFLGFIVINTQESYYLTKAILIALDSFSHGRKGGEGELSKAILIALDSFPHGGWGGRKLSIEGLRFSMEGLRFRV